MTVRVTSVFAILFIIAHAIAAILLCRERLFLDSAYYFFHVVNEEALRIEHQRIILALSQSLLFIGVRFHLPMTILLYIYSLTPVIYAALLIYASLHFFKSEVTAWLIMLTSVCGSYFLYYSPMYEVCYAAISLSFLWLLLERRFYKTVPQVLIFTLLFVFVLFGYPLMSVGILVMFGYHALQHRRIDIRVAVIGVVMLAAWLFCKYYFITDYEKGKVSIGHDEYSQIFHSMFSLHFLKDSLKFFLQEYTAPMIGLILFVSYCIRQQKYAMAIFCFLSVAGFIFLVNFSYRGDGLIHSNNFERMYLLLIALCFAPVAFYLYPFVSTQSRMVMLLLAALLSMYASVHVWQHSVWYTQRLVMLRERYKPYQIHGCTKAAVKWDEIPDLDEWSTGMEALIYSSEKGHSIVLSDREAFDRMNSTMPGGNTRFLLRLDEVIPVDELNSYYFKLDTLPYCR